MPRKPRLAATQENDSGRNTHFIDNKTGESLTRAQAVRNIEQGKIDGYHIREINGVKTPVSNPDSSEGNNLG